MKHRQSDHCFFFRQVMIISPLLHLPQTYVITVLWELAAFSHSEVNFNKFKNFVKTHLMLAPDS